MICSNWNRSEFFLSVVPSKPSRLLAALLAALGLGVIAPTPAPAQAVHWHQVADSGPASRYWHALAYDTFRGVTVLFGGQNANVSSETWEWNGVMWTQRVVSGPPQLYAHAMAYDSVRRVTVLFGGSFANTARSDMTWEWNGNVWTNRAVAGPVARSLHAMVFDSARGVTVLFGGYTGTSNGETWEWNGATWTQRVVSGPAPRYSHAMAYDSARGVTTLFGGVTNTSTSAETWEWNGATWTQRVVSGPVAQSERSMAYDSARGVTVLFGSNSEPWEWNGTAWTQVAVSGPSLRSRQAMVYDTALGVSVLYGGNSHSGYQGDTWVLGVPCDPPTFTIHPADQVAGAGGSAVFTTGSPGSLLAYQWQRNGANVTNGARISGATSNTLTIANAQWSDQGGYACRVTNPCGSSTSLPGTLSISSCPPSWVSLGDAGFGQALGSCPGVFGGQRAGTLVFGGRDSSNRVLGDTWLKKNCTWSNRTNTGPAARSDHAMAALANGHVLLFGGKTDAAGAASALGDTWEWNGNVWVAVSTTGPAARLGHAMALDSVRGRVVMFGGLDTGGAAIGDTWEWNGSNWVQVAAIGPSARFAHAMAFSPVGGETLVVGGLGSTALNDTWAWNGVSWRQAAASGFPARYYSAAAFDVQMGRVLLLGGVTVAGAMNDSYTWDDESWSAVAFATSPTARWTYAMSYDATSRSMVVSGGAGAGSTRLSDWWEESGLPIVTSQPRDLVLDLGANAVFSVGASRTDVTYQWRKDGIELPNDGPFSGVTTSILTISDAQRSDIGGYDCIVANVCGATTSHSALLAPSVLYVNAAAAAGGNGFSWATAMHDLQSALETMRANHEPRQIWVAQGTYRPDRGTRDREASFQLIGGVTLIGGFAGSESNASQRDPVAHPTILTGDLGAAPQNSYRVVSAQSLTAAADVVGFTVRSAFAQYGNNVDSGGGIFVSASRINLTDCVVTDSQTYSGLNGGVALAGIIGVDGSHMQLTNCRITRNTGLTDPYEGPYGPDGGIGWGIICDQSTLVLTSCVIAENRGGNGGNGSCTAGYGWNGGNGGGGGGLRLGGGSTALVTNSVFVGNWPGGGGSGAYCNVHVGSPGSSGVGGGISVSSSNLTLVNCDIVSNSRAMVGSLSGTSLQNCIIWNSWGSATIDPGADVQYSSLPAFYPGQGNIFGDPRFADMAGLDLVIGTQDDDLRLVATSPCIDAGDNTALATDVLTDLNGEARFVNDPAPDTGVAGGAGGAAIVDMGAYERQVSCLGDYDGDGGTDGSDVSAFFHDWEAGNSAADVNADGGIDGADVNTFFSHWEAGC